jgi:hypothetical protein
VLLECSSYCSIFNFLYNALIVLTRIIINSRWTL